MSLRIGVLALQGDVEAHRRALEALGAAVIAVRAPADLARLDGIAIPGGESTVMSRLCERYGLMEPLRAQIKAGLPAFGTCAGLIFLAREVDGGSHNFAQTTLGVLDVKVLRNAYGAQIDSFEAEIPVAALDEAEPDGAVRDGVVRDGAVRDGAVRGVFIRAPRIENVGADVEVLASWQGAPVMVRQGAILALSFHPEIAGERRIHQMWLDSIPASLVSAARTSISLGSSRNLTPVPLQTPTESRTDTTATAPTTATTALEAPL